MNEPPPIPAIADFKDRHGGLIGFGILVILIGCVCALFVPLMILAQTMSARTTGSVHPMPSMVPVVMVYAVLAVVFISLGIGSTMARRWARALLLILASAWLVTGIFMDFVMAVFLPKVFAHIPAGGEPMPDATRAVMTIFMLGVFSVVFVILPGLLVLFYRSPHVKATCEARDPVTRWTDACPLPVLALSFFLGYGAVWMIFMLTTYHSVMPFFGRLLSGVPGGTLILLHIALWIYCAWAIYHLKPAGWWIVLIAFGVLLVSSVLTFSQIDLMDMYRLMGYPEQQIERMQQYTFFNGRTMVLFMSVSSLPSLGYLLYVKRYFPRAA